jgi:hypothetical protein
VVNLTMAVVFGAIGGSLRGLLAGYGYVEIWLRSRRDNHLRGLSGTAIKFHECADWRAEAVGTLAQIALAVLASTILYSTETVSTIVGLILGGASAPAILAQLGQVSTINKAVIGPTGLKHAQENNDSQATGLPGPPLSKMQPTWTASGHAHDSDDDVPEAADA